MPCTESRSVAMPLPAYDNRTRIRLGAGVEFEHTMPVAPVQGTSRLRCHGQGSGNRQRSLRKSKKFASSHPRCDTVSCGDLLPEFRRTAVPPSSGQSPTRPATHSTSLRSPPPNAVASSHKRQAPCYSNDVSGAPLAQIIIL